MGNTENNHDWSFSGVAITWWAERTRAIGGCSIEQWRVAVVVDGRCAIEGGEPVKESGAAEGLVGYELLIIASPPSCVASDEATKR